MQLLTFRNYSNEKKNLIEKRDKIETMYKVEVYLYVKKTFLITKKSNFVYIIILKKIYLLAFIKNVHFANWIRYELPSMK